MESTYFRTAFTIIVVGALFVLTFLVLKPILMSILLGLILAFIFSPVYDFTKKYLRSPNLSAIIICLLLIGIVILPLWFFTPVIINQAFKIYLTAQQTDFAAIIQTMFPSSEQFASEIGSIIQSFVIKAGNSILDSLSQLIINFPTILLHLVVVLFTFYFALRDRKELIAYVKSLSPFTKEVEDKLFKSSKDITASVLYGQVVIGIVQGIIASIAFFIFGVPNAILLSILAVVLGILPIVGPMFVWVPVMVYFLIQNNLVGALGILVFGIISSNIDNILRPVLVSRLSQLHSAVVLISMIGGLFLFGVLGIVLGPLILAYLLIILEVYRGKSGTPSLLIKRD